VLRPGRSKLNLDRDDRPGGDRAESARVDEETSAQDGRGQADYPPRSSEARFRRALHDTEVALARAQALYRVSASLIAIDRLDPLLQRIVDVMAEALPAYRVHLFAVDFARQVITGDYVGGHRGTPVADLDFEELMEGLAGWVLRNGQGTLSAGGAPDPRESPRVDDRRRQTGHGPMMVAPVVYGDRRLGVMVVVNRPGDPEYTQDDLDLLTAMASHSAVAIENAAIREAVQRARDELEERVQRRTAELTASEERYRRITETITDYVYSVTMQPDGTLRTHHGPGCVAVTGYSPEEFAENPDLWIEMVVEEDRGKVLAQVADVVARGPAAPIEHRIVRKDGAVRLVRSTPVPHPAPDGSLIGYDGLVQDVTERRALEEQLVQASKLQSIGRLAGGIAHDFNNLLTAILGNTELALADMDQLHPARESVTEIRKAAERAATLTRQLLAFARKQMIEPVAMDLGAEVAGSIEMLRRLLGEDIEITTDLAPDLGLIMADPGQVQQLLINLTVNARDAMRGGGRLVITVANQTVAAEYRLSHPEVEPGWYVALAVTDTGTGMSKEVQNHLFEPFFTTKRPGEGTGLGLAMCHGIVNQNGGHIWVHSEIGQGTTVTVLLPVAADAATQPRQPVRPSSPASGTESVLVVEDDSAVRRLAVLGLRSAGYSVLEADNPADALQLACQGMPIDLVVSDVVMPGMHGPELAAKILAVRPGLKVLLVSGHADLDGEFPDGANRMSLLAKPFTPARLATRVRELLDAG
jgi:PAS domain S-box-containing protein